ncbi:sulfotransferase family 2 domain-containing protein [Alcanivorax jadensis]|uniref:sulfotransferase family 2 domain-containing protein n=1 Tax=Alcanivorax jadensis TaxID=64988 RepID=UPI00240A0BDE|nr:sulfotransferase family 2 domain-containing protein [Alcanivorax jadensis]MDF1637580.1 sulfotransferase family 2 domain-containing protein [Alcanivorax jadensis]
MLTRSERLKIAIKGYEFLSPVAIESLGLTVLGKKKFDPWLPEERRSGVIFSHVPKSAGTSIVKALFDSKSRHVPILRYAAYDKTLFENSFKFTVVRNPWARIFSAYNYLYGVVGKGGKYPDWRWADYYLSGTPSFESFVLKLQDISYQKKVMKYIRFRSQCDWISIPGRGLVMDYVGRFERVDEDFEEACHIGKITPHALPHLRKGTGSEYRNAYSSKMAGVVAELYKKDIQTFDYHF